MRNFTTEYGTLCIGSKEELFKEAVAIAERQRKEAATSEFTWALTGGSTPAEFYRYVVANKSLSPELMETTAWFTSDERAVPLESDESNFGNASRMLLDPLGIDTDLRYPWPVDHEPDEAAPLFNDIWKNQFSEFRCFDLCFLGMGDDCHTASIFPQSPLIENKGKDFFAYIDVPGKGPRLTITRAGFEKCGKIVPMVLGKGKALALRSVLEELYEPREKPIQMLREYADRTIWLVDEEAASELSELE
ncbi:MAG TPA: 6-phosphogluconolactonase [Opitutales bacterium]|nr:6-phosphogluconolactonase [Opitutales bacterium]